MIDVIDLKKSFGDNDVLRGIDITINLKDGRQISRLRYSRTTDTVYMGDGGIRLEGYISGDKNARFESIFYK